MASADTAQLTSAPGGAAVPSRALGLYVRTVVAVGAFAIGDALFRLPTTPQPLGWSLFAMLAILTGSFTLKIAATPARISVSDTFFTATALLFGPAPVTVALAVDSLIVSWRSSHAPRRVVFNVAAPALSMWCAAQVFFKIVHVAPLAQSHAPVSPLVFPLFCFAAVSYLLNSGLTAVAIGLETGKSPFAIWDKHFRWLSVSYLAAGSAAFCLILLIYQISLTALIVILPLVAVFHLTLRSSFGRLEDAHRHLGEMDRLYLSTVETLAMAIDAKDDVTHSHVRRVQMYAVELARALGETDETALKALHAAALLHDTGKLAIPEHILNKPSKLTDDEFEQMKRHADIGADILSLVDFPFPVVPIVRCHHENWDGTGYPRGVAGSDIPLGARILAVVDCFDALTSDRPYRPRMTDEKAFEILFARRGTMYDPAVVDAFARIQPTFERKTLEQPHKRHIFNQLRHMTAGDPHVATPASPYAASDDVLAFVSLSRLAAGEVSVSDVLALASRLIRGIVPEATIAWYLTDANGRTVSVADASGPAASSVRGMAIGMGERLTGWVAANRQVIVGSDAALDLGDRARTASLQTCMSVPLSSGESVIGALTLYASAPASFSEDQGRLVQMIAPHVADAIVRARRIASAVELPQRDRGAQRRELRLVESQTA